jgi:transcriptional regulator with XRE-family HTH domain
MKTGQIVAKNIRKLRTERGWSQEELAAQAGLNRNYVGMIERCENSPTVDTLDRIARALNVEVESLLERASKRRETRSP